MEWTKGGVGIDNQAGAVFLETKQSVGCRRINEYSRRINGTFSLAGYSLKLFEDLRITLCQRKTKN